MEKMMFDRLGDMELISACIEPTILQIRGRELSVKAEKIAELHPGQQALCMFRLLFPAQGSADGYASWVSYLHEQPGYWQGIMGGLRFFGDTSMIALLEETAETLGLRTTADRTAVDVQSSLPPLFEQFQVCFADSLQLISAYIRSNPDAFVTWTS
ncbi:hypothetical protein [Paenibacillus guangzhouensis]|uniref:hypothetical protein n=1 Tax=Paenibacillus guangzhouensis TaxID=1473112 RepID=UPI00187B5078|nr:hypothetical protein [Paenibacillus guangzhouensis]